MARYTGPRVRISRRFGVPIFGPSKYLDRRGYPPGMHGPRRRRKLSDYALSLMEKQKLRYYYGLQEKQFRRVYEQAARKRGVTGEIMLQILELRLDNVVYRLGFASSRPGARQMVVHGHIEVNGRRVTVPSYALRVNDVVEVRNRSVSRQLATRNLESSTARQVPEWLSLQKDMFRGVVLRVPTREEINPVANEQTIVEFYSR
ncbi:MAG: 30S ribosomal protein S4 [Verrucomicrobia bacterium]|nr:30S ribosomal protein S4 [Verrucomicrobiota bacterium]